MNTVNVNNDPNGKQVGLKSTFPVGTKKPVKIDLSGGDVTLTQDMRIFTATTGSVIMVDMACSDGNITDVPIPPNLPVFNVTKIKQVGTDAENILAWPMEF